MLRSAAGKVMWVGRATVFVVGLAVILALLFGVASAALAGTGVGATFNLGKTNTVNAISKLVGSTASSMLVVDNNGTGSALSLQVGSAQAPLTVNASAGKATNLNADKLDDREASTFADATHQHSGTDITSGTVAEARIDATIARDGEVVTTVEDNDGAGSGLDADLLDGKDSTDFQPSNPCPSGTLFHEGACIETINRDPAGFPNAEATCLQAGRRLPTVAELQTFRLRQDLSGAEFTSHVWFDANGSSETQKVMLVDQTGRQSVASGSASFRCVSAPNVARSENNPLEAAAQSTLRKAVAAATLCAASNDNSYANCATIAQLEANGYQSDSNVTLVITTATATRWAAEAQHNSGGSAYRYDTETAQIVPIPRF